MNKALWGKLGQFKWALVAAIVVLLTAIFATWRPVKYPATQAYVVGSGKRTTINSNYAHTYVVPNISLSLVATNPGIDFSTTLGRDFCSNSATVTLA